MSCDAEVAEVFGGDVGEERLGLGNGGSVVRGFGGGRYGSGRLRLVRDVRLLGRGERHPGPLEDALAHHGEVDELDLSGDAVDRDGELFVDVLAVADGDDQPLLATGTVDADLGQERAVRLVDLGAVDAAVALERLEVETGVVGVLPESVAEVVELALDRAVELVQLLFGLLVQAEPCGHRWVVPSVSGSRVSRV